MAKANAMLSAALDYAKRGWHVFPILSMSPTGGCECTNGAQCDKAGKHPAIQAWNKNASVDPQKITEWWGARPDRGIGIATGEISGLTVLDVDGDEGVESLGKLSVGVGMPNTPTVQSRAGRYHYYFAYEPSIKSNSNKLGAKLDTRGDNGYVVAPPSRHSSGGQYKWLVAPDKAPVVPWPDFLSGKKAGEEGVRRGRPEKEKFNPDSPRDVEKLLDALAALDPDDEERWSQVGWIMGRAFHQNDVGFKHYSAWASRSRKYDQKRTKGHYYERSKEIRGGEIKTTNSIYNWATEAGWTWLTGQELEPRNIHVFENPYRESSMVREFGIAAAASQRIFVMGLRLIHIVLYNISNRDHEADKEKGIKRDPNSYMVLDHNAHTLSVELGDIAAYWAHTAKGPDRQKFNRQSTAMYMACCDYTGVKPLLAFVSHPTIRGDGTMIDKVGYDAQTQLYLTSSLPGLVVNDGLTQKQAKEAMTKLLAPFDEYPWASPISRSVFCAALFTVGIRHLFDIAPLFAFSSPKHGTGKTQLAECLSRLWYGTDLSKATWTPNPEEMEKRIAAFLLAGDRIVCLDNVTEGHRLEDSTLNKVLTSRRNTFRLLGKTERMELTNEATWFATGNQLTLAGDIARRALLCYVDAKVVDPGSRTFSIEHLPNYVAQHRTELMGLALSILASWIRAGKPVVAPPRRGYGSFVEWYAMIRPLLMWVGEADIADAIDTVIEEDTEGAALEDFANKLRMALPPDGSRMSLMSVMGLMKSGELRSAFAGCMNGHANTDPNHRSLGELLRRCENKIFVTADGSGDKFTVNKLRDRSNNQWVWGCVEQQK